MKAGALLKNKTLPSICRCYGTTGVLTQTPDPFADNRIAKGKLVVYGQSTSRVNKVLWAAAEAGLDVEQVKIRTRQLQQEQWYYDINPKLTVPCMRDGDLVINESNSIVSYICNLYAKHLYPDSPDLLALAWQWLEYGETTVAASLAPVWFGVTKNIKFSTKTSPADVDEINKFVPKCAKAWRGLDEHLGKDNREYILGNSFSMADFTLGVQADRLKQSDGCQRKELQMECFPYVNKWLERLESRSAFQKTVGKSKPQNLDLYKPTNSQ